MTTQYFKWRIPTVEGYPVVFELTTKGDAPWWMATLPDLPGCMSDGQTRTEALDNLQDAATLYLRTMIEDGIVPPHPYTAFAETICTTGAP